MANRTYSEDSNGEEIWDDYKLKVVIGKSDDLTFICKPEKVYGSYHADTPLGFIKLRDLKKKHAIVTIHSKPPKKVFTPKGKFFVVLAHAMESNIVYDESKKELKIFKKKFKASKTMFPFEVAIGSVNRKILCGDYVVDTFSTKVSFNRYYNFNKSNYEGKLIGGTVDREEGWGQDYGMIEDDFIAQAVELFNEHKLIEKTGTLNFSADKFLGVTRHHYMRRRFDGIKKGFINPEDWCDR